MNIKEISFEILWGNPNRLKVGGPVNLIEITAAEMFAHAEWSLAVGRQLLETEAAKLLKNGKGGTDGNNI